MPCLSARLMQPQLTLRVFADDVMLTLLLVYATGVGAQAENEMKASLAEVFCFPVVPLSHLFRFIKPASAVMKTGWKGVCCLLRQCICCTACLQ